jgi:hypothetical protein
MTAERGNTEALRMLLACGAADTTDGKDGKTALELALERAPGHEGFNEEAEMLRI